MGWRRPPRRLRPRRGCRRATERAAWTHSLPWRIVAVLAVGLAAWLLATQVVPHLAAPAGVTVAAGLAWRLRFRVAPDTLAWRRGAAGERRTARLLAPLEPRGRAVLHDLAIPGTQASIDGAKDGRQGLQQVGHPPGGSENDARVGGLAGRPGSAAVPRRRLTASPDQRSKRRCFRGFTGPVA